LFADVFLAALAVEFFLIVEDGGVGRTAVVVEVVKDACEFTRNPIRARPGTG
jgi:hypothetical protein